MNTFDALKDFHKLGDMESEDIREIASLVRKIIKVRYRLDSTIVSGTNSEYFYEPDTREDAPHWANRTNIRIKNDLITDDPNDSRYYWNIVVEINHTYYKGAYLINACDTYENIGSLEELFMLLETTLEWVPVADADEYKELIEPLALELAKQYVTSLIVG